MGSPYTVKIVGVELAQDKIQALQGEIESRLREVNRQMSHYQPDSEISRFNRAPAKVPFKVSPEFARVVRFTLELCRKTQGALDPTLAPVISSLVVAFVIGIGFGFFLEGRASAVRGSSSRSSI